MKIGGIGLPELMIICVIGCGFGAGCLALAEKKGYSKAGFFCLGFFLNLIGLIIALVMPYSPSKAADSSKNANALNEADALVKYKQLLDDGVISQDEFEAKKRDLI